MSALSSDNFFKHLGKHFRVKINVFKISQKQL